jgi:hypothetical protein
LLASNLSSCRIKHLHGNILEGECPNMAIGKVVEIIIKAAVKAAVKDAYNRLDPRFDPNAGDPGRVPRTIIDDDGSMDLPGHDPAEPVV